MLSKISQTNFLNVGDSLLKGRYIVEDVDTNSYRCTAKNTTLNSSFTLIFKQPDEDLDDFNRLSQLLIGLTPHQTIVNAIMVWTDDEKKLSFRVQDLPGNGCTFDEYFDNVKNAVSNEEKYIKLMNVGIAIANSLNDIYEYEYKYDFDENYQFKLTFEIDKSNILISDENEEICIINFAYYRNSSYEYYSLQKEGMKYLLGLMSDAINILGLKNEGEILNVDRVEEIESKTENIKNELSRLLDSLPMNGGRSNSVVLQELKDKFSASIDKIQATNSEVDLRNFPSYIEYLSAQIDNNNLSSFTDFSQKLQEFKEKVIGHEENKTDMINEDQKKAEELEIKAKEVEIEVAENMAKQIGDPINNLVNHEDWNDIWPLTEDRILYATLLFRSPIKITPKEEQFVRLYYGKYKGNKQHSFSTWAKDSEYLNKTQILVGNSCAGFAIVLNSPRNWYSKNEIRELYREIINKKRIAIIYQEGDKSPDAIRYVIVNRIKEARNEINSNIIKDKYQEGGWNIIDDNGLREEIGSNVEASITIPIYSQESSRQGKKNMDSICAVAHFELVQAFHSPEDVKKVNEIASKLAEFVQDHEIFRSMTESIMPRIAALANYREISKKANGQKTAPLKNPSKIIEAAGKPNRAKKREQEILRRTRIH
jgi:hypothetical protein